MLGFLRRKSARTIEQIAAALDGASTVGVTQKTALQVSTVLACVRIIADSIAVPELKLMQEVEEDVFKAAKTDPHWRLLHRRPNDWQTSFDFRWMMTAHAALTEEAVAIPVRDPRNERRILEIIPLLPQWVSRRKAERYQIMYDVSDEFGPIGSFRREDLLIIRNLSWEMVRGLSVVEQARNAIGLSISAERAITSLQDNGGRPSGILSTEGSLSADAVERLKASWKKVTTGKGRSGVAVLDNGYKFHQIAMSAVDQQSLETRRMQVEEVCRAFGVYPIMVGHSDKATTYASAEAMFAAHNRHTALRWQRLWIEHLDEFVLDGSGPLGVQFDNRETQLAPLKDQGQYYARALGSGGSAPFMTVNEVRKEKGLPPLVGHDELREPIASTLKEPEETSE